MAATYADWPTLTTAATRYARFNLHLQEVGAQLAAPDVSADGKAINRASLVTYYNSLLAQRDRLQLAAQRETGGSVQRLVFRDEN